MKPSAALHQHLTVLVLLAHAFQVALSQIDVNPADNDEGREQTLNGVGEQSHLEGPGLEVAGHSGPAKPQAPEDEIPEGLPRYNNEIKSGIAFDPMGADAPIVEGESSSPSRRNKKDKRVKGTSRSHSHDSHEDSPELYSREDSLLTLSSDSYAVRRPGVPIFVSKRVALFTVSAILLLVWVVHQISLYNRAAANLTLLQSNYKQLISQLEKLSAAAESPQATSSHSSGARIPSRPEEQPVAHPSPELKEDAWNAKNLAELSAVRSRIANLQQKIEDLSRAAADGHGVGETAGMRFPVFITDSEAQLLSLRLEATMRSLEKQRKDLEEIVSLKEKIKINEDIMKRGVTQVLAPVADLGLSGAMRDLVILEKAFADIHDSEKVAQVRELKEKLTGAIQGMIRACPQTPGLAEASLWIEKGKLLEQLDERKRDVEAWRKSIESGSMSVVPRVASAVRTSAHMIKQAAGSLLFGQGDGVQAQINKEVAMRDATLARANEKKAEDDTLAMLERKLRAVKGELQAEEALAHLHHSEKEVFKKWLDQKSSKAVKTLESVITSLSLLKLDESNLHSMPGSLYISYISAHEAAMDAATAALSYLSKG
ncbi:hypothetical protein cyc_01460 [Cyclospora cayetanensis]|uniref:Uncharacterized protein n=1 Tax=Cyclospora cayetanensis TaxID=88456 RepID=A0A1D3CR31_9EIME|nr:hypothetical protein cyc_01460 [Cyclospora cayetanensis]